MEKLNKCTDCPFTVTTVRQLSDHRWKEHGFQNVICPYCPKYAEFKMSSALKRQLRLLHPLHDEELFTETGKMYYFPVKNSAYRSIPKHIPGHSSVTAGRACALLCQWATTCRCASSSALLHQAEKDWAGLSHNSQPLFPGKEDLPEDLDVLALMEKDRHLPEVSDIPLPPLPPPQPPPSVPLEPPPPTILPPAAKLVENPASPSVPPPQPWPCRASCHHWQCLLMTYSRLEVGPHSVQAGMTGHRTSPSQLPCLLLTNWDQLSQEKKLAVCQAISALLSWLDEPEGKFPDASPSHLMDSYSFMALPGSGVGPKPQAKADRALGELRVRNHQALKTASAKDLQLEAELVTSLQGSHVAGPARRRALLHQVKAPGIPLRPLWKSVPPPPPLLPKRPKPSVDMYSPTRPEM